MKIEQNLKYITNVINIFGVGKIFTVMSTAMGKFIASDISHG